VFTKSNSLININIRNREGLTEKRERNSNTIAMGIAVGMVSSSSRQSDNIFFSIMEACSIAARGAGSSAITFSITKSCIVP